jgi:hypothetical protein
LVWTVVMLAYGTVAMALTIGRWALKGSFIARLDRGLRVLPFDNPQFKTGPASARK